MKKLFASLVLLASLVAIAATAIAGPMGATPPAPGAPRFAQLVSLEGLPADSTIRLAFMNGFRDVFADEQLRSERDNGGGWQPQVAVPNRFRLLEGSAADDAWTVQVVIGAPAPAVVQRTQGENTKRRSDKARRASRGMIVSVIALSPEARQNGARPLPQTFAFAFPAPPPPADASQIVTSSGYTYSWTAAGQTAGKLALEVLHHFSEDLSAQERADITPAVRTGTGR
ncbi:MAG: hypothetical protein IPJ04_00395 [Candidatus Eisenbacteria bacterium]|jgi:hypothetical protein|nr:hypothetical protein [Candidatus Eisenbacteria bacterium]